MIAPRRENSGQMDGPGLFQAMLVVQVAAVPGLLPSRSNLTMPKGREMQSTPSICK